MSIIGTQQDKSKNNSDFGNWTFYFQKPRGCSLTMNGYSKKSAIQRFNRHFPDIAFNVERRT